MKKEKNLAIIPARAGSKGLKNKNIKVLYDKPLIAYTIENAIKSLVFDDVVVSTDSEEIANISREYGASVPFLRPKKLSTDEAKSSDVIVHCLDYFGNSNFDSFCLLQPTSPLRTAEDIKNAFKVFIEKNANSVLSVCEVDHSPLWSNVLDQDLNMDNFLSDKVKNKRRQELPVYYRINGAIYFSKVDYYLKYKDFFIKDCYAYIMKKINSIDIDNELDFFFVEFMLKNYKNVLL